MSENKSQSPRTIQSLDRAVQLLNLLASRPEGLTLTELAATMNLKPQTVQSLLRTLEYHGLVIQGSRGAPYMLGARIHQWSHLWLSKIDVVSAVQPIITRLAQELGEYVLLAKLQGHVLLRLLEQTPNRTLVVNLNNGNSRPIYQMVTGEVLLAGLEETQQRRILAALELPQRGPEKENIDAICKELQTVRNQGYAEHVSKKGGIAALAIPVAVPKEKGPLALGVAMPLMRYKGVDQILPALRRAGEDIQNLFGACV